jgi:hypothetical protein
MAEVVVEFYTLATSAVDVAVPGVVRVSGRFEEHSGRGQDKCWKFRTPSRHARGPADC